MIMANPNSKLSIKTPQGCVISAYVNGQKMKATLTFNHNFGSVWTGRMTKAQKVMDSEVLRLSTPYVPHNTFMLRHSGIIGTVIGSGEVCWLAPYAAAQYYNTADHRIYDALCGAQWFERMKINHKHQIIDEVKKVGGGNG